VPLLLGALAGFVASFAPVSDSDAFWHLALGRDLVAHGLVRADTYSWTVAGSPQAADQWLGELLEYTAYAFGSWRGLIALRSLAVALLATAVTYTALAERPRRPLAAVIAVFPALVLSRFTWTDRPELLGLLCYAALLLLLRAGIRGSLRALALCPPLLVAWANLHGSYAVGLVLVLLVAAERAWSDPAHRRGYAALAIAAALATLVTPAGIATWTSSGGHFLAPPRYVQEEGVPDITSLPGLLFAGMLLATLGTALLAPRRSLRDALPDLVILVPTAFLSLTATRHLVFFPIAAAPFLARFGPDAVARVAELARVRVAIAREGDGRPLSRAADVAAAAVFALLLIGGLVTAPREPELSGYPVSALSQLPAGAGLLNRYEWGGFLIWYAPATPVFVDGRLFPYVGDALDDYRSVIGLHADWRDVITRRGIRTLLVAPSDAVAVRAQDLGWPVLMRTEKLLLIRVP